MLFTLSREFSTQSFMFYLLFQKMEGNEPGQVIGQVFASDADEGINAELDYSIIWPPEKGSNPFQMGPKGEIIAKRSLDREKNPEGYHFMVSL
ncbi:unnamed protein product [Protopolystoma xenopodis]|uniref:Cadherin domain-containing protein n=1 Tax=Protopolystoma xenopodis TaxID=117903 RepID=A0A448X734_9PLAT|nr:unnamed protein product [Protopolystoma xenopodis]